jgi:hypothetical protein
MSLRRRLAVGLCVAAAVFFVRTWFVLFVGSDVPFWDQWEAEALAIYKPYLEGTLQFSDLFQPHNEHRIVFTHLLNLALLKLNAQWDPLLQMLAGAAIHSCTAGLVTWYLRGLAHSRVERCALLFAIIAVSCLPFGWQNTLWGFQSQVYFSILFSLAAMGLIGLGALRVRNWVLGIVCAGLAFLSMGSSAAIGLALIFTGATFLRSISSRRRGLGLIAIGALLFASMTLGKPDVAGHAQYQAQHLGQFLPLFASTLSWPLVWNPALFLVTNLPLIVLVTLRLLKRIERQELQDAAILIGVWVAAIGAGFAFYRGGIASASLVPASRYFDFLCFGVLANAIAAVALVQIFGSIRLVWRLVPAFAWGLVITAALVSITLTTWKNSVGPRIDNPNLETLLVTHFRQTGDPSAMMATPVSIRPTSNIESLRRVIGDPDLARVLPPSIHQGLPIRLGESGDSVFRHDSFPSPDPPPGFYEMRTCFAEGGNRTGEFRSAPFDLTAPGIELTLAAGLPDGGGSVELVRAGDGVSVSFLEVGVVADGWMTIRRWVEPGTYSLVARSESEVGWFSFSAPRPVGPLSMIVRNVRPFHSWFLIGAGIAGIGALLVAWPRDARGENAKRE